MIASIAAVVFVPAACASAVSSSAIVVMVHTDEFLLSIWHFTSNGVPDGFHSTDKYIPLAVQLLLLLTEVDHTWFCFNFLSGIFLLTKEGLTFGYELFSFWYEALSHTSTEKMI